MRRLLLVFLARAVSAAAAEPQDAIRTTLVQPWLEAVRTQDPTRLTKFLHPKVQACVNDQTREYFESGTILKPRGATAKYKITLAPWNQPGPLFGLPATDFSYPVQPTYELSLQFEQGETEVIRYVAPAGNSWFIVVPCPNENGMALIRRNNALASEQKRQVAQLVANLKDPLLSELRALRAQGRLIDAIKKYQQATGLDDLALARMVIKAIEP